MITHTNDIFEENTAFLPLPDFYRKNSYDFFLVKREGDVAIFEQKDNDKLIAYEVFEIRKQKAAEFGNVKYEAKEKCPGNEEWGINAYTVHTYEAALERMAPQTQGRPNRASNNFRGGAFPGEKLQMTTQTMESVIS